MENDSPDVVVVGGGFYGAAVAERLAGRGSSVVLIEREAQLLARASFRNQARVHLGYHYPRSFVTASRALRNAPRFMREFQESVVDTFPHFYAIARRRSNVTASQFRVFCDRIGAPLRSAPAAVVRLFDPALVEAVFEVDEPAFDGGALRACMTARLERSGADVRLGTEAQRVEMLRSGRLRLEVRGPDGPGALDAREVFNCTYAGLNGVLSRSGLPLLSLHHELAELALVQPPPILDGAAVTVMCGPFFSSMPFPSEGLHSLSHVRYTPHRRWATGGDGEWVDHDRLLLNPPASNYPSMVRDAARYLPCMGECRLITSLWEIKTLLPRSEVDDSRPILFRPDHGVAGLTCLAGAKLDNVYDVLEALETTMQPGRGAR